MTDQTGHNVNLIGNDFPSRIVSLVPSQTELLYDLGLEKEVFGITKFCIHPEHWRKEKIIIGGTKKFRLEEIDRIKPDLIIANKEENYKEGIEALRQKYPVYTSDIYNLEDAYAMISDISVLTDKEDKGSEIITSIQKAFQLLEKSKVQINQKRRPKVAYLIWNDPIMVAGNNTFIDVMLKKCGFENVFGALDRYPEVSLEDLKASDCDVLLLSSEPYPFKEKHIELFQDKIELIEAYLVDGEFFSWYGSRLMNAPGYFMELISILAERMEKLQDNEIEGV